MTPTKPLIGQVLTVFAIVVGVLWGATQWTAEQFGYQRRLGPSWFELGGMPVYLPWRLFEWWYAYEPYAPEVFNRGGMMAAAGRILGVVVAVIGSLWRAGQDRAVTTYGSVRWTAKREIASAGQAAHSPLLVTAVVAHKRAAMALDGEAAWRVTRPGFPGDSLV